MNATTTGLLIVAGLCLLGAPILQLAHSGVLIARRAALARCFLGSAACIAAGLSGGSLLTTFVLLLAGACLIRDGFQ
jgi:hypothetical protein